MENRTHLMPCSDEQEEYTPCELEIDALLQRIATTDGKVCFAWDIKQEQIYSLHEIPKLLHAATWTSKALPYKREYLERFIIYKDIQRFLLYNQLIRTVFEEQHSANPSFYFSFVVRLLIKHKDSHIPISTHIKVLPYILGHELKVLLYILSPSHIPTPTIFPQPSDKEEAAYLQNKQIKLVRHEENGDFSVYDRDRDEWSPPQRKPILTSFQQLVIAHAQSGSPNKEIAARCGCCKQYVGNTLSDIYKILGVDSLPGALCAIRNYKLLEGVV